MPKRSRDASARDAQVRHALAASATVPDRFTAGGSPRAPVSTRATASDGARWVAVAASSRQAREPAEVRGALLLERLTAFLGLFGAVEQQVGFVRQLLDAGVAVLVRVEAHLGHA